LVFSGKRIAKSYAKSWFTLDLVSSVPWDFVTAGLLPGLQPARLLKIGKIAKVLKLLRVGKVIRMLAGSSLIERMEEVLPPKAHQTISKILYLVTVTLLLCHWLACLLAAVDGGSIERYLDVGPRSPVGPRYLAALYWAMTTLTTVGYGDITPASDNERLYAMLAMIIGGSFYGYMIGCMTSVITDMDIDTRAFNERMEMLDGWLDFHDQIPTILRRRLRRHFRKQLRARTSVDTATIVKDLSPELRSDAAGFVIHLEVRQNAVFRNMPNSALGSLMDILQTSQAKRGENIVAQGDPGLAMYIIVEGTARFRLGHFWLPPAGGNLKKEEDRLRKEAKKEAEAKRGASDSAAGTLERTNSEYLRNLKQLIEGDSFGEEIIFTLEESYRYTIAAEAPMTLCTISEDAFKKRFRNLPDVYDVMLNNFMTSKKF
jgi:CRP-like cAMP-binding protein